MLNLIDSINHFFKIALLSTTVAVTLLSSGFATAQVKIDISGVGTTQIPVAIAGFVGESDGLQSVSEVIRRDLERSGNFRIVSGLAPTSDTANVNLTEWRAKAVDAVVTGSVNRLANGKLDVRFRLSDTLKNIAIDAQSLVTSEADIRFTGHRIADLIFEKLTGEKGIFATRIAFVSKAGSRYRLNVSDWDGENVQAALNSSEPIISPKWSLDGSRLAYVSFENKKPVVYAQNIFTQVRTVVANFKGSNSAPAWAPDGKSLAVVLTRDGFSQIYVVASDGSNPRRLTQSSAIDTEPSFSPDGQTIYFTSDRGGSPQIYRVAVSGGDPVRVSFNGSYNVSPRISPDGKRMAWVSRREGRYSIFTRELAREGGSPAEVLLGDTGRDESPSFSPNSRWVLYAANAAGKDELRFVTTDGKVKLRVSSAASDIREPAWGPLSK